MTLIDSLRALLERCSRSQLFSYATILLLQLKVVWGYWNVRDVSSGDTASYFVDAYNWFRHRLDVITWSPLYTAYYGWFLHISDNAVFVTFAHRMVLVFILAALVLGVMRRIFSPGIAWLLTAWWVVLPTNFDSAYEVHLFALIPVLVALVMVSGTSSWRNGVALASLLAGTLLVRNEMFLVLLPVAAIAMWAERNNRPLRDRRRLPLTLAYGLPFLLCILLTAYFYLRASDAGAVSQMMHDKQAQSACQAFSFGYQQRHPDQNGWLWAECDQRMQEVFGKLRPTFLEAVVANPGALGEHFLWNVHLLPAGLELLMFGSTSGGETPDFGPPARSVFALPFGLFILLLFAAACYLYWKDRPQWRPWFIERRWVLLGLASLLPMNAVVILTQRPRPEYLFSLEIALLVAVGWALLVIAFRLPPRRIWQGYLPIFCLVMIWFWPSYANRVVPEHTLARTYSRLKPARSLFERVGTRLVTSGYGSELCSYLGHSNSACTAIEFNGVRDQMANGTSLETVLGKERATLFYADAASMRIAAVKQFVTDPGADWEIAAYQSIGPETWALLEKKQ